MTIGPDEIVTCIFYYAKAEVNPVLYTAALLMEFNGGKVYKISWNGEYKSVSVTGLVHVRTQWIVSCCALVHFTHGVVIKLRRQILSTFQAPRDEPVTFPLHRAIFCT